MTTDVGGIRVRILGDDSDLQSKLGESTRRLGRYAAAAAAAGAAVTAALVKSGLQSADAQAKLARGLGGTTEGLGALQRAAGRAGVSTSELESATLRLNQRLGQAMTEGGKAKETLDTLGLSAQDLSNMDVDERMATLSDRMNQLGFSSQQTAFHLRNLGIRQSSIVNLMQDGGDAIRTSRQRIEAYGLALTEVDAAKVEAANDAMEEGSIIARGFSQQLAVQFSPVLQALAEMTSDWVAEFGGLGQIAERVFNIVIAGAGHAANALRGVQVVVKGAEVAFWALEAGSREVVRTIVNSVDMVRKAFLNVINRIIRGLNRLPKVDLDELVVNESAAAEKVNAWADSARESFDGAVSDMHDLMMQPLPGDTIRNWADGVKEAAEEAAQAAVDGRERAIGAAMGDGEEGGLSEEQRADLEKRLESIREANLTELELAREKHHEELEILREAREAGLEVDGEYDDMEKAARQRHENEISKIEERGSRERSALAEQEARNRKKVLGDALSGLTSMMNSESRKMFEVGKAAAIAQSVVSTYQGMTKALELGWPLGPIAAGAIGAAGFANVQSIRSQSFGSGGGGAGSATQQVSGNVSSVQQQQQSQQQDSGGTLRVEGITADSLITGEMFMKAMNEAKDDGMIRDVVFA